MRTKKAYAFLAPLRCIGDRNLQADVCSSNAVGSDLSGDAAAGARHHDESHCHINRASASAISAAKGDDRVRASVVSKPSAEKTSTTKKSEVRTSSGAGVALEARAFQNASIAEVESSPLIGKAPPAAPKTLCEAAFSTWVASSRLPPFGVQPKKVLEVPNGAAFSQFFLHASMAESCPRHDHYEVWPAPILWSAVSGVRLGAERAQPVGASVSYER
jgi:hypothetical protein